MLTATGLKKSFGDKQVLHGVSFSVQPGEITAIVGPSGGGKSTLLRALSLLEMPDEGEITVDDLHCSFPSDTHKNFRRPWPELTLVFQQLFLWPHLTLMRNITLPLERRPNALPQREVEELIELFELKDLMSRYPNEISLGQRQRVALVRALALRPKYLLLDEITSALDVEHVSRILNYLLELRTRGVGILLVTHLIGFAKSAADQIIFMENGRVIASGGPSLLVAPSNERLAKFLSLVQMAT